MLHERFMAQEPERIGNARWTFERFCRHVNHEVGTPYPKFMVPLARALDATEGEMSVLALAWLEDVIPGFSGRARTAPSK